MFIMLYMYSGSLLCQEKKSESGDSKITPFLEYLIFQEEFSEIDSDELYTELTHYLYSLLSRPLNINSVTEASLERFILFTPFENESIINYLKEYGQLFSLAELYLIPGLSHKKIELIEPFLTVMPSLRSIKEELPGRSQILVRSSLSLQRKKGYSPISRLEYESKPESRYLGNPLLMYGQYRYTLSDRVNIILTTEKDPGERGVDFISWSMLYKGSGYIERVVAGSYNASFGQGLVISNSFPVTSVWEPNRILKRDRDITSYGSSDENLAFKGAAVTSLLGPFSITMLASVRQLDARVTPAGYTSLLKTGLHNTPLTLERKGSLGSRMIAMNLSLSLRKIKAGITICTESKSLPYAGRDSALIKTRDIRGGVASNLSVDWRYLSGKTLFSGEAAISGTGSLAFIAGVSIRGGGGAGEFTLTSRFSDNMYSAPMSNLARIKGGSNVSYLGCYKYKLSNSLLLLLSCESAGEYYRAGVRAIYSITKLGVLELRGELQSGRRALRAEVRIKRGERVSLITRGDITICSLNEAKIYGYHIYHEVVAGSSSSGLQLSARLAWFSVPAWTNRIYTYERDMLYQFRTTALYGEGLRYYLNVRTKLFKNMELWFRISSFTYFDRDKTGEGPEEIQGPSRGDVKLQLRYRF